MPRERRHGGSARGFQEAAARRHGGRASGFEKAAARDRRHCCSRADQEGSQAMHGLPVGHWLSPGEGLYARGQLRSINLVDFWAVMRQFIVNA